MSIGMSYDEYWYGEPERIRAYREADRLKRDQINLTAWLNGMYVHDALSAVMQNAFSKGSKAKYPEKPHEIFRHEPTKLDKQAEAENERQKAIAYFKDLAERSKLRKQVQEQKGEENAGTNS